MRNFVVMLHTEWFEDPDHAKLIVASGAENPDSYRNAEEIILWLNNGIDFTTLEKFCEILGIDYNEFLDVATSLEEKYNIVLGEEDKPV